MICPSSCRAAQIPESILGAVGEPPSSVGVDPVRGGDARSSSSIARSGSITAASRARHRTGSDPELNNRTEQRRQTSEGRSEQLGVGLAVAILLDATLIRVVLLPSMTALPGDRNWYLPTWAARAGAGKFRGAV